MENDGYMKFLRLPVKGIKPRFIRIKKNKIGVKSLQSVEKLSFSAKLLIFNPKNGINSYHSYQRGDIFMLGRKKKDKPLFYYFSVEKMIPEDHILRLINKYVDFSFIRSRVRHLYSYTGRPSIDPEVLIRMLLVGYLYSITSERKLCEEVRVHTCLPTGR